MAVGAVASGADVRVTGRRVLAIIVDGILFFVLSFLMSLLFGTTQAEGGTVGFSLTGLPALVYSLIVLLYFILLEGATGQTVGKMLLGIKVVREGTTDSPGYGKAVIRTLLRIVDSFPFVAPYLVGFVVVLISGKNQRIGDMAAGTLVIRKGTGEGRVA